MVLITNTYVDFVTGLYDKIELDLYSSQCNRDKP